MLVFLQKQLSVVPLSTVYSPIAVPGTAGALRSITPKGLGRNGIFELLPPEGMMEFLCTASATYLTQDAEHGLLQELCVKAARDGAQAIAPCPQDT